MLAVDTGTHETARLCTSALNRSATVLALFATAWATALGADSASVEELKRTAESLKQAYRAELRSFRKTSAEFGELREKAQKLRRRVEKEAGSVHKRFAAVPNDTKRKYVTLSHLGANLLAYAYVREHVAKHQVLPEPSGKAKLPLRSPENGRLVDQFLSDLDKKTKPWREEAEQLKADPELDPLIRKAILRTAAVDAEGRILGFRMKMLRSPKLKELDAKIRSVNLRLYGLGALPLTQEKGKKERPPSPQAREGGIASAAATRVDDKAKPTVLSSPPTNPKLGDMMREAKYAPVVVFMEGCTFDLGFDPRQLHVAHVKKQPARPTTLSSFWIGKYEVTAEEFCHFLNDRPGSDHGAYIATDERHSPIARQGARYVPKPDCARRPVNQVSWYGAAAYCRWLSERTGSDYRLPTEAEWDLAAYGPERREYPWGDDPARKGDGVNHNHSWLRLSQSLKPVHEYERGRTPQGLHHMIGNVAEWCADNHFPIMGGQRPVLRGGSWLGNLLRTVPTKPEYLLAYAGLRVARTGPKGTDAGGSPKRRPSR